MDFWDELAGEKRCSDTYHHKNDTDSNDGNTDKDSNDAATTADESNNFQESVDEVL